MGREQSRAPCSAGPGARCPDGPGDGAQSPWSPLGRSHQGCPSRSQSQVAQASWGHWSVSFLSGEALFLQPLTVQKCLGRESGSQPGKGVVGGSLQGLALAAVAAASNRRVLCGPALRVLPAPAPPEPGRWPAQRVLAETSSQSWFCSLLTSCARGRAGVREACTDTRSSPWPPCPVEAAGPFSPPLVGAPAPAPPA